MDLKVFFENAAIIIIPSIIAATLALTKWIDPKKKYRRLYPLIPILLGSAISLILAKPFNWQQIGMGIFCYAFGAMAAYNVGKNTILGK